MFGRLGRKPKIVLRVLKVRKQAAAGPKGLKSEEESDK